MKNYQLWPHIIDQSSKILHLIEFYTRKQNLNKILNYITSLFPHYALVVLSAEAREITKSTREYINVLMQLKVPITIIVTKLDMVKGGSIRETDIWGKL